MGKFTWVAIIIAIILIVGGIIWFQQDKQPDLIGGQTDSHGCLIAAGYSWSEQKQSCVRTWEEDGETKMGYIRKIYAEGGKNYIDFDEIKWLSAAQGTCTSDPAASAAPACNPNGYLIVNDDKAAVKLEVTAQEVTQAGDFDYSESGTHTISYGTFQSLPISEISLHLYVVVVRDNQVVSLRKQYQP